MIYHAHSSSWAGAAELVADAAGKCGVWRAAGFASRSYAMIPREALAKARHPWAILRSSVGADVSRSEGEKMASSYNEVQSAAQDEPRGVNSLETSFYPRALYDRSAISSSVRRWRQNPHENHHWQKQQKEWQACQHYYDRFWMSDIPANSFGFFEWDFSCSFGHCGLFRLSQRWFTAGFASVTTITTQANNCQCQPKNKKPDRGHPNGFAHEKLG
jgi:hypothetical protein